MEKIYRKISLEDFKNRFTIEGNNAFGTEWGNVVQHDYTVDSASSLCDVADRIPLLEGNRLRFGTMIMLNTWLNNVIDSSDFFKLCQRRSEKVWIQYDYSKTAEDEDFNFAGIYQEMPLSEEEFEIGDIIWVTEEAEKLLNMFLSDSDESQSCVIERIGDFFSIVKTAKENRQEIAEDSYAIIDILLTENNNETGKFTKGATTWEPNKIYYGGQYALDPISGLGFCLSEEVTSESTETFNENGTWNPLEEIKEGTPIITHTESHLDTLKRLKRSYDDYGKELPFIYNEDSGITEILYAEGIVYNITTDGSNFYGDAIIEINKDESASTITFTYVMGATLNNNGETIADTGIIYAEGYKMSNERFTFRLNNQNITVDYISIHFDEELSDYLPEEPEDGKRYAAVMFKPLIHSNSTNSSMPFIMEESMVGVIDIIKSGTATVERGTAAAFEIHNILGECRTMEDLEKYRNDFFTIKDDEKQ